MNFLAFLPLITNIIEKILPDPEKQAQAKVELLNAMAQADKAEWDAKGQVIQAEAKGESWLQRNWRPITMLSFLILLSSYWFGFAPEYLVKNPELVSHLFTLLEIGIGGYIVGRSAEKVAKNFNQQRFFDTIRKAGGSMTQAQVDLLNKGIKEGEKDV